MIHGCNICDIPSDGRTCDLFKLVLRITCRCDIAAVHTHRFTGSKVMGSDNECASDLVCTFECALNACNSAQRGAEHMHVRMSNPMNL